MKTYKPIAVAIDNEESDDGFFSVGFIFNYDPATIPHNIALCRDTIEDPTTIYIEPDDQIYGFSTRSARFSLNNSILTLEILDKNTFYWNGSKVVNIEISSDQRDIINQCLARIFSIKDDF